MEVRFENEIRAVVAERVLNYTLMCGKASSVQFVYFPSTEAQALKFIAPQQEIILPITHLHYGYMAILPENSRRELAKDFE